MHTVGGIHPRVKKIVGTRLAKAARALAYGDQDEIWTGPVLESCVVKNNAIELTFDQEKMKDDVIQVLDATVKAIDMTRKPNGNSDWTPELLSMMAQWGSSSPMEVQLNGRTAGGELSDGIWIPTTLQQKCSNTPDRDTAQPGQGACSWNVSSSQKLPGACQNRDNID